MVGAVELLFSQELVTPGTLVASDFTFGERNVQNLREVCLSSVLGKDEIILRVGVDKNSREGLKEALESVSLLGGDSRNRVSVEWYVRILNTIGKKFDE